MAEKESALAKLVHQAQLVGYRDNAHRGAEELFLRLRENHPEFYSELMRLARAEFAGAIVVQTELRSNWPDSVQNQVEVEKYGEKYTYLGEVTGLWSKDEDIRGNAKLTKLQKNKTIKKSWKIAGWFPPKIEFRQEEQESSQNLWTVWAGQWNAKYILCNGGSDKYGYSQPFYYRGALNDRLSEKGIKLPHELFELIFAPIDAEILWIYQKMKK